MIFKSIIFLLSTSFTHAYNFLGRIAQLGVSPVVQHANATLLSKNE